MKEVILSHIEISDDVYDSFVNAAELKHAARKEIIFYPGRVNKKILFVEKGILRAYRLVDGTPYTHFFFMENWFVTDFQSYLTEQPSDLYIESLTERSYYEFSKKDLQKLYQRHHEFEKLGRIIAEKAYLKMVERLTDLQTTNLRERYHRLVRKSPQLLQKVPQKYIASYLGVSEQSLSRIKTSGPSIS